ncbi:hypothetical protein TCE0_033r08901 [Talaromyces pinophilus]|uniref:Uncharacterized protein n=1 Tax=Talaromyces pinophilus TaxID=128442 RepID=A0A6V8HAT9_TALPI|nr:hypothetical protein DPV78_006586 [Talaromyces pinophilus]PCH08154.1 Hypothetical protein PENO1_008240 [Penicillium occitanis (nom. inval.)]PCH10085.1 hypothetical protein PENOC_004880 [Penicillium occitanis (nom. inval.)]GAM38293.1 hypothetical protein TCE0_033r08901 [Talaromyces pinophilus]
MSDSPHGSSSSHLEPPQKGPELEDPGAQESASEDEHFSDASEGQPESRSKKSSRAASPVPITRVERVDDEPRHGEVPGTPAYDKRTQDAVPDEVEIVPEGSRSRSSSRVAEPTSPGGTPIPRTMVVRVDESPSYGEVPGTEAYNKRKADAVPDLVLKTPGDEQTPSELHREDSDQSVPETRLFRVDSLPKEPGSPGLHAHRRSPSDALPDVVETVHDTTGDDEDEEGDDDFGDEFDDFEEGANAGADDDFGDFDEGFGEPVESAVGDESGEGEILPQPTTPLPLPPLLDFTSTASLSDLLSTTNHSLDTLFPETKTVSSLPPLEPIPDSTAIFGSERSLSLWSQLVAPPPLQPPNWVKSRIRRLFLVSLGVPVDLDEILPASKQKKLILPSINPEDSSTSIRTKAIEKAKQGDAATPQNDSTTSVNSTISRQKSSRRRGQPAPPELDLFAVRRLCATTDAALDGFTDTELQQHVVSLETASTTAKDVLDYWVKRTDGLIGEKEAFEGVIENLVNHARRARK